MADTPADAVADLRERRARGALRALKSSGEDLLGRAVEAAPVEEGTLRASAELAFIVNDHRFDGAGAYAQALHVAVGLARAGRLRTIDAEVSFNAVYAARQHEELDWHHPLSGGAKYLERPLLENTGRYRQALELEDRLATSGAR